MRTIRARELSEGRWRNGLGVSWDIAADRAASDDFGWRLAIARIDADVPFSHYPDTDRIFTLIEGNGLDLDFAGRPSLAVDRPFVPHVFACDLPTFCRLRAGPCRALNLFTRRGQWRADAEILTSNAEVVHPGPILVMGLDGAPAVNGETLRTGDTAIAGDRATIACNGGLAYVARLRQA